MEEMREAFEMVLGAEFLQEMGRRLLIIACSIAGLLLLIAVIAIWKSVACGRVRSAILSLSEHPDDAHASALVADLRRLSAVGRFFAKHSKSFGGLPKGDCRMIYNLTVLPSPRLSGENKRAVREALLGIGCTGLTEPIQG